MVKFFFLAFLAISVFVSCGSSPRAFKMRGTPEIAETPRPYIITDFKNMDSGSNIPFWVRSYLDGGIREMEDLDIFQGYYVFVSRNEGTNFNALGHWNDGFETELDFPRMAAARVEARFVYSVPYPDDEYGPFYEALVRTASDDPWTGAQRQDDFWLRRKYFISEISEEDEQETITELDTWEFLILVTIEKNLFASSLERVFQNTRPNPQPLREQIAAANRVKDRFYDGF